MVFPGSITLRSVLSFTFIFLVLAANAATYTTTHAGPFTSASTWSCTGCVGIVTAPSLTGSNTININHSVTYTGNFAVDGTTTFNVNNGGKLTVSSAVGTSVFSVSNDATLNIANGGEIDAPSITFYDYTTQTTPPKVAPTATINGILKSTTSDITFPSYRSVYQGSTGQVTSAGDITFNSQSSVSNNINGKWSSNDFTMQNGGLTGSPTFNLTGNLQFGSGNAQVSLSSATITAVNMSISGGAAVSISAGSVNLSGKLSIANSSNVNTTIGASITAKDVEFDGAGTINITGSTMSISNNYTFGGSNIAVINSNMDVAGDFIISQGGASTYNGTIKVKGKFTKQGGNVITLNNNMTVTGAIDFQGGNGNGVSDVIVGSKAILKGASYNTGNDVKVVVNGSFDISGAMTMTGSSSIVGTGVVGWKTLSVDGMAYIGCATGAKFDTYSATTTWPAPSYDPLQLSTCDSGILPVSFLGFTGKFSDGAVSLFWGTAREKDNSYFIVERSTDGKQFDEIGRVNGAGQGNEIRTYFFQDQDPLAERSYYRLMQVDINNQFGYSSVIELTPDAAVAEVFPNPSNGSVISVRVDPNEKSFYYTIRNMSGMVMTEDHLLLSGGLGVIYLAKPLSPGMYMLELKTSSSPIKMKLVVKEN